MVLKVYIYLDESGSIHKNSKTRYFAVGGYFTYFKERNKIISIYKRINKDIKIKRDVALRNIKVGKLNGLEDYLNTEFCLYNYSFKVTYYDSSTNYGIQLADLIVNTFYNSYKKYDIVKNVMPVINHRKFLISLFPYYVIKNKYNPYNIKEYI